MNINHVLEKYKHNINTNDKVFCVLAKKINQKFQKFYDTYVDMQLDERFIVYQKKN